MFQLNGTRMYSLVLYKKTFLYSSPNYHLISLLDIISKHYVNLVLISLVFWSQYSIVILNYTVQLSITLRKMFQEPQIYTLIREKRSFMTLSRLYLILIPGNRQVLSMDSTWLSHWNYFYDIINRFFFLSFSRTITFALWSRTQVQSLICTLDWVQIYFLRKILDLNCRLIPQSFCMLRRVVLLPILVRLL